MERQANNTENTVNRKDSGKMQDNSLYKGHKAQAKEILSKYSIKGKVSLAVISNIIKKDAKQIKKAFIQAKNAEKAGKKISETYKWIYDNYYMLEDRTKACIYAAKQGGRVNSCIQKQGKYAHLSMPVYCLAFREYADKLSGCIDETSLDAFIHACNKTDGVKPDFSDCYSYELLFSAALISKLADICRRVSADSDEKTSKLISSCITSLHFLSSYSFDKSLEGCEAEEYLRLDPSGHYSGMTEETKHLYRHKLAHLSRKKGVSEGELAKEILEKARSADTEKMRHIGAYLYPEKTKGAGTLYFCLLAIITLVIVLPLSVLTPFALLTVFPVWEAVKQMLDRLFAVFVTTQPLPRLKLNEIPDTAGVLVVVTTLLLGEKSDDGVFSRLEKMYLSNGMKNVYFAVLGDLTDSAYSSSPDDNAITQNAENRISALNSRYPDTFFLFLRKRRYSKTQQKFMGYERKRGAVAELVSYLCGSDSEDFIRGKSFMSREICDNIRYVITLDADTNLPREAVRELAGLMLHPLNRVKTDKKTHTVVSGYGIMQPSVCTELASVRKTPFAGIMCGAGGIDVYSYASFDLYQSVFSESVFCGKGIFDKFAYNEVINHPDTEFPEDAVLSHDILEGARLRCALVSDMKFTDGFPKNETSYFKRHHRWVRGDVQNLSFLKNSFVNAKGEVVKNRISALSKFKLFDNFRRAAVPVLAFAGIVSANFLTSDAAAYLTLFSVLYLLFPFLSELAESISKLSVQCAARRYFSKGVMSSIWQNFLRMLFEISMLPRNAFVTADAFIRSFWRINFSKRNMLEWVTAAQSDAENDGGLLYYIQKNLPGAAAGAVQFIVSPYGILKLIGLMWFFFPAVSYLTSKERKKEEYEISTAQKSAITEYVRDMWKYFEKTVTAEDNYITVDNLQLYHEEKTAHRTSPTNIGLYLLCVLCARDFEIINTQEMYKRLNETLSTVEKLPKWQGHLYNWYDTETLDIMNPSYISSVDSGNFLACLVALKEGLKEYVSEKPQLLELILRTEKLFDSTATGKLYNKQRNLFYLGATVQDGKAQMSRNCFDMLMSEARTLSYIALALRAVPKIHGERLSRPLIKQGDRIGVASWTGTAFEYFMPAMFLPSPKGSLMYEALRFAFYCQRKRRGGFEGREVWGISESGYNEFDGWDNYRYKAFGIPELGCQRGLENDLVISPYSSFLAMCLNSSLPLDNLDKLKKCGMYGKYGFYEALDLTRGRCKTNGGVVKSYMSHHVGMSIISCANACFDNIIVKRFMSDKRMASAAELLEEKIPVSGDIKRLKKITGAYALSRNNENKLFGR